MDRRRFFHESSTEAMLPSGTTSSALPQATITRLGKEMDVQHWPRTPTNLIMHAISVLNRRSDSRLDELRDSVKSWEEWDTLTALANYHSVVEKLFGFLKEVLPRDQSSHAIATEIFEKMSQDVSTISAQMTLILCDSKTYKQFLACRGSGAQRLLDLVQDLLDSFAAARPLLSKALIRLSRASGLHPRCFVLSGLEKEGRQVAAGGYGDIWKGRVLGQSVSVKMMRVFRDKDIQDALKAFGREALIWRQLSHPNLLPFFGLYYLESRLCLVSPWMENGHVLEFLKNAPPDTDRLSLIVDVATGLQYLHIEQVVHGDLKGMNILITPSGRACICDFGVSSIADAATLGFTHSTANAQGGSARYQAPEVLSGESSNHYASDVYAFACVCYEILTEKAPFFELLNDITVSIKVIGGDRPSRPEPGVCDPILWILLQNCWHQDPNTRPSIHQIAYRLVNPPIDAKVKESTPDWDETSTSKFRRHFQDWSVLPSITEIERRIFGNDIVEDCADCFLKYVEQHPTPEPLQTLAIPT
ncbi:kinase-like domain-containing protein [Mycena olivaceomarginata]|nr:kinase-like domain-containing protein [Mycena olivaceomarginata]